MKVPTRLLVLVLVALGFGFSTPSTAGDFIVFGGDMTTKKRLVVPRDSASAILSLDKIAATGTDILTVVFTVSVPSYNLDFIFHCASVSGPFSEETTRKSAVALALHLDKDGEINPIPLLASLGIKECTCRRGCD